VWQLHSLQLVISGATSKKKGAAKEVLRDFWRGDIELFQSPRIRPLLEARRARGLGILTLKGRKSLNWFLWDWGRFSKRGDLSSIRMEVVP